VESGPGRPAPGSPRTAAVLRPACRCQPNRQHACRRECSGLDRGDRRRRRDRRYLARPRPCPLRAETLRNSQGRRENELHSRPGSPRYGTGGTTSLTVPSELPLPAGTASGPVPPGRSATQNPAGGPRNRLRRHGRGLRQVHRLPRRGVPARAAGRPRPVLAPVMCPTSPSATGSALTSGPAAG
jgi:hypothetical protein